MFVDVAKLKKDFFLKPQTMNIENEQVSSFQSLTNFWNLNESFCFQNSKVR